MQILNRLFIMTLLITMAGVCQKAFANTKTILPLTLDAYVRAEVGAGGVFNDDYGLNRAETWADDWVYLDDGDGVPEIDMFASAMGDIRCGDSDWGAGIISSVYAHDEVMMGGGGLGAFAMTETAQDGTLVIGTSKELPAGSEVTLWVDINADIETWYGFYEYQFVLLRGEQVLIEASLGAGSADNFYITTFAGETLSIDFWHMADATAYYEPVASASGDINIDMRVIPEPATLSLLALGAITVFARRK